MFIKFKYMIECQYNTCIKFVQSNGGTEFKPLISRLVSEGVIWCQTCPKYVLILQNKMVKLKVEAGELLTLV